MGYNRIDDEEYQGCTYAVTMYVKSDCYMTDKEKSNYKSRIKECFYDNEEFYQSLNCATQENKSRGKTRINNIKLIKTEINGVYPEEVP